MIEVALDYLAVGIDPTLSIIVVQSQVPELTELTMLRAVKRALGLAYFA